MNIKILKTQLFALFSLTIISLAIFYYRDSMPDNYLSISSTSTAGFFSYYSVSWLNFINYYTGSWVSIPFLLFTGFYIFQYSKRADTIDTFNFFTISVFTFSLAFFFLPKTIGAGLYQAINTNVSGFLMFGVLVLSQ